MSDPLDRVSERRRRAADRMPASNIVVFGKAGVGKSTLLNAMFGLELAKTGVGRPVTTHLQEHRVPGVPVAIVDTRGVQLDDDPQTLIAEFDAEHRRRAHRPQTDWLHVVWYCVNSESARFEDAVEGGLVRHLAERVQTLVVMTRAYDAAEEGVVELRRHIEALELPVAGVVPVLALERRLAGHLIEAHGLEELVDRTRDCLPTAMRQAFVNAQVVRIDAKVEAAFARVDELVGAVDTTYRWRAFFVGDMIRGELFLEPVLEVVGEVAAIFGEMTVPEAQLRDLAAAVVGSSGPGAAARVAGLVGRLLTWIPPVGPTVPVRIGGKLVTALAGALMSNHQDRAARLRIALLERVIGRAVTRTCEDIARAGVAGAPLTRDEVSDCFGRHVEDEARHAAER